MSVYSVERIPDKYKKLGKMEYLGHGSMHTVYHIAGQGKEFALKIITCGNNSSKYDVAKKEIEIMRLLSGCSLVINLLDTSELDDNGETAIFILEEYAFSLFDYMQSTNLSASGAIKIAADIATAMMECEKRGIIHLDIQPNNIFLDQNGKVVLGDFSSALLIKELGDNKRMRGTMAFMAPEVYRDHDCSIQSDIYSLGLFLYWMLNNMKIPFSEIEEDDASIHKRLAGTEFPSLKTLSNALRVEIEKVIHKACDFDKCNRYLYISEMKNALDDVWNKLNNETLEDCIIDIVADSNKVEMAAESEIPFKPSSPTLWSSSRRHGWYVDPNPLLLYNDYLECCEYSDDDFCDCASDYNDYADFYAEHVDCYNEDPLIESLSAYDDTAQLAVPPLPQACSPNDDIPSERQHEDNNQESTLISTPSQTICCNNCGRIVGNDNFCPNCGAKIIRENIGLKISKVYFSTVAPCSIKKGEYSVIDVIMYEEQFRLIVDDIIARSSLEVKETKSGMFKVIENEKVKMIITSPDIDIEDNIEEREWTSDYLVFNFSVLVPEAIVKSKILFVVTVYINNIIATRLKFTANVTKDDEKQEMNVYREDIKSAFVSFADQDKDRALRVIQGIQIARPDMDMFLDLDKIRSREDYDYAVKKEIDYRDVFYLCWSAYAKKSKNVNFEWRYALEQKGSTGIDPLPLELPENCPPPSELAGKHFDDKIFIHMNSKVLDIPNEKVQITKSLYLDKTKLEANLNGESIALTKLEYNIFECLVDNMGRVLSTDTLIKYAWGDDYYAGKGGDTNVRRIITQIRDKLGDECIKTVRGFGYKVEKTNDQ